MTQEELKIYEEKVAKAKRLTEKNSNLKRFLEKLDARKIKVGGIIQEKIREPLEWSNDFCWQTFIFEHIDYDKLAAICREEVKRQTLEQLKIAEQEFEELNFDEKNKKLY